MVFNSFVWKFKIAEATGKNLSVKSAKIVAGLEVHKTLELLKLIGVALDQKVSNVSLD